VTISEPAAAVLALVHNGRQPEAALTQALEYCSAEELLASQHGLLADQVLQDAQGRINQWSREGIRVLSVLDPAYPENLTKVADRPALIFISGCLEPDDARSVAVIGSRRASRAGEQLARAIAGELVSSGYTVNSGLAAGIDMAAHDEALACEGRAVAVIGTGLRRVYPRQNAWLQERVSQRGAVVSQFWPDSPASPANFRRRNAVMSGLSLATVIVEASARSGARIQARASLAQGRPVLLAEPVLGQEWARQLAQQPGVVVISSPSEIPGRVARPSGAGRAPADSQVA
jgi:DNA processing protein